MEKEQTVKVKTPEQIKLEKEKEKEKARLKAQKEKEKEKARLKAQKEKEKEKAKLKLQKEKEAEKLRLEKEKEKENAPKPAPKKAAPKKPLTEKEVIKEAMKKISGPSSGVYVANKGAVIKQTPTVNEPRQRKAKVSKKEKEVKVEEVKPLPKKKVKVFTKEEKLMYKKLGEYFNYIANLTNVVEEKTMDKKGIPDLTLGELHVVETVNEFNGEPMTKIADELKVTVGSLTIGVNRLVQKEYLERIRDEKDHRIVRLVVTPKGKRVLKFHDKFHEDILLAVLDGVTIRDASKVMAQFTRVIENYYKVFNAGINEKEMNNNASERRTKEASSTSSKKA